MCDCNYIRDDALGDVEREKLRELLTPRRALDGSLVWPVDELGELERADDTTALE